MTRVMYDSVSVGEIPADAAAVALYIDGDYPNWTTGTKRARKAKRLSIAVHASDQAECLDIENGDATPWQAPGWVRHQLDRGVYRPVIYASRDNMLAIIDRLHGAGIDRSRVRLWSAHYGQGPHICSGKSCGAPFTADATQWTDRALGRDLDESLLDDSFFPAPKPKKKLIRKPKPVHPKVLGATGAAALSTAILASLHALGLVQLTPAEYGAVNALCTLAGGWTVPAPGGKSS